MSKRVFLFFGVPFLFFLVWEWSVRALPHLLFILPAPSDILRTLWKMHDRFWFHTSVTLKEMCWGFFLALTLSFPLAWIMMRYKNSRTLLQPFFIVIQCIPMFTLAPIMVVWFGWGYTAIIIPTALMIFFPLTLNIYQGLKSTPADLLEFFQTNQATATQIFFKLRLPFAVPHIFAGFRIASAIAGVSAVAGEWAGAQEGLGILMLESRRNSDLEITFGALFCLTTISALLYLAILFCEKIALPPRQWIWRLKAPWLHIRSLKKRLAISFLIITLLLLSASCAEKPAGNVRLLLDWLPNPNHIPLYVGLKKGYFQAEGIDLTIQKMQDGGGGISYLVSKKADLLINHMPGTLKACERGAKLKIVGLLIKEPLCGLTYRDDPSIKKVEDLCGKVFGYCIGLPDVDFLNFLLKSGNITPREKKNVSIDLVSAMGTGAVDFIYGGFWNIEPAQLRALGVETQTFKIQELGVPPYYEMIILANAESECAAPQFVERFQRALQKSLEECKAHPDDAFACFLEFNKDRSPKSVAWQKEAWEMTYPLLADNQTIDPSLVETFYLWQLKHGILEQPTDWKALIN